MTLTAPLSLTYRRTTLYLLLLLAFAFGLRVCQSGSYGLFLDEKYTIVIAHGVVMEGSNQKDVFFTPGKTYFTPAEFWKPKTFADFMEANARGDIGNSPFYYGVLWLWMQLFGWTDFGLRLLSVLFSTLTVGLIFGFVRRHLRSEPLAWLSAGVAAIEPFFVAYSHMARNYSLSFFLTLLATHVFLLLVERDRNRKPINWLLIGYGALLAASVLSHYLTVTVFLCHGLYLLFYARRPAFWARLGAVAAAGMGVVSLWFLFGAGQYTFKTLAYQAEIYKQAAITGDTHYGVVLPATLKNVGAKMLPIVADLFMPANGLGSDALGSRNRLIAIFLGCVAAFLVHRYRREKPVPIWVAVVVPGLLVAGYPLYFSRSFQLVVMAAMPTFIYLLVSALRAEKLPPDAPRGWWIFMGLLAVVPTLFLVLMTFRNGHTYGLTQRYSGFSFPYAGMFVALLLREVWRLPTALRLTMAAALGLQAVHLAGLLLRIYEDRDPKYTYFLNPRTENPYYQAAQKIEQLYAPGDTVLYPSVRLRAATEIDKTYAPYAIQDAQLTNLYLPRDAKYLQRMDTTQTNRILLVKKNGQRITVFDFEGTKYRY
jgi:uncharacterized membrane protein